ncbi:cell envelope biogenesis protein TolA [Pantoea sp. LMR881]|uniref:cell envelope integrity TolA C-terminal domain-containing protein n=1 Tax=Pantoea sp. LMR881 TaxID=3014336 RepID=UPI0022AF99E5|nr:cell envelope integrity TolA C-terminal domain-containing protein [Pantoea sp. LMR881]MCZ4059129.1 cell envelope biogenesis protein TolA [Pantoea sp. LMR881]
MLKGIISSASVALLLAGCSNTPSYDQETNRYLHDVQSLVTQKFGDTGRYAGQRCVVTAERRADGLYNVLRTEGNEALCLKAWQSVSSARGMPLPPKNAPQQLVFVFPPAS